MWDATSDIVDSMIFQKTSEIGIGTTAPAATLDVNGKSDIRDTLTLFPKGTDYALAVNRTAGAFKNRFERCYCGCTGCSGSDDVRRYVHHRAKDLRRESVPGIQRHG